MCKFRTLKTTSIRSKDEGGSIASVFSQFSNEEAVALLKDFLN